LEELKLKGRRFAELIFGVLIMEDLLAILLLVALSAVIGSGKSIVMSLLFDAGKLILVVGSWFLVGYFVVPMFFRRVITYASQETLTIVAIAFCLLLVSVAGYFGYTPALGAFIMGSILAETPQVNRIEELIRPIRDIFAAVFFVSVGMLIDPKLIIANFGIVCLISLVTVIGKIFASSLGALLTGQSLGTSLRVGFGMAQIGEFSFIIVGMGLTMGVISDQLYPIVVAVSAITTFTTPYLIRISGRLALTIDRRLPPEIKRYLSNYSSWIYHLMADKKDSASYRKVIIRFVVNAIIVAVIFTFISKFVPSHLSELVHKHWLLELISWVTAILLSSPFLWAMLFAARWNIHSSVENKNAYYLLMGIIWVMVIAEVVFLTVAYFYSWVIVGVLFVIALAFFTLFYARLGKFYYWFEENFLANIGRNTETHKNKFEQLAPWDNRLVSLSVAENCQAAGKSLQNLQIRQEFHLNIVAIQRNQELIVAPRGEQLLLSHDKLVVLGHDDNIEEFKAIISAPELLNTTDNILEHFVLKPVLLSSGSPLIGQTIRDSQIRERAGGLVVGLERAGQEILNPDPSTRLAAGDLLLMVGKPDRLKIIAAVGA
jgi:CPA2 family monovalent cation:H+ antiporter-2